MTPQDQLPDDDRIEIAATILAAMAYPLRMRIVLHLLRHETTGGELSRELGVNRDKLARHLRHLRVAGLLRRRRAGSYVLYGTTPSIEDLIRAAIACADLQTGNPGNASDQGTGPLAERERAEGSDQPG